RETKFSRKAAEGAKARLLHVSFVMALVTLLTDFGTADYFVGAMKGAILSVNPAAHVLDLTHEIPPHDIEAGAFTLYAAAEPFPQGTIHVAVVDPGVGSARRPLAVVTEQHLYVGPDNGLFGHVYAHAHSCKVFHLTNREHFRRNVSATFHGRDVFAPVAGALSLGIPPEVLGEPVSDYVTLPLRAPFRRDRRTLEAALIHIDRFGNCVTNITRRELSEAEIAAGARLTIAGREVNNFRRFYAEDSATRGQLFAIWGSAGYLEISAFQDSAARLLNAQRGDTVLVMGDK
ncbi:MAG TPA: SAM-dependent chlorinase/fluorinase, partial [Pyrinomonadaceae bacterium]|nr:SAM-dependent chlorinase/fluorinase [Pyrinomonadaceae bacterium]